MSEIDYHLVLDNLSDAVLAADGTHRIVYANAAAERLLGWSAAELVGQALTAVIPPRFHAAHREGFKRYLATHRPKVLGQALRLKALRRDGTEVAIELQLSALRLGEDDLVVASLRDQGERLELERQLRAAGRLKATAEATARLAGRADLDGVLETVVSSLVEHFGAALARVWRFDPGAGLLRLRAEGGPARPNPGPSPAKLDAATSPSEVAEAARGSVRVVVEDPAADPRVDRDWAARERIACCAAFPMRAAGELWGVLSLCAREPFAEEDLDALAAFAAVASGAINDVEVLAREQAARLESERQRGKLLAILETLPLGVVLAEADGGWASLGNAKGREIWGPGIGGSSLDAYHATFPLESLDGRPIPPADRPLIRALGGEVDVRGLYRKADPDGRPAILEVTASPLPGPGGGAIGTFRDVTDQVRLESELAERAAQIKALLDHLPVGVAYFDDAGVCRACNGPARRILGLSRREIVEVPATDLLSSSDGLGEALGRCIREAVPHATEGVDWPDPAGEGLRYLDWRFEPLPPDAEGRRGALALIVDVTDRTLAERALQEAKDAAERGSRLKTQFLSAVSHDLRTPVNALSLQAELLSHVLNSPEGAEPGELRDLSSDLRRASSGLVELINDLLDLTRFESGQVEHHPSDFALDDWLHATLAPLAPTARAKNLEFTWSADRPGRVVRADRVKLSRVLVNLVGNAIKFTESGRVAVTAGADDRGWLNLKVEDTGPGIPEDQRARVFDEFAQLRNPERDRTKGTGLGLAICRRLVEAVGGRLTVGGQVGSGSLFTASYPPDHLPDVAPPAAPARPDGEPGVDGRATILLVEDDDQSRRPLSRLLQHAGFAVEQARDGGEALAMLGRSRPSLVLLDLMLPGMDGIGVLRNIRGDRVMDKLPVVVLSGDVLGDRIQEAQALGIAGLLAKPVDFDELRALVGQLLPRPGPPA